MMLASDPNKARDLLRQAIDKTESWAAALMKPDKSRGVLDCMANVGFPDDWAHITNALDQTTGNGRCFLSAKPVLMEDVFIDQPDGGETYHFMSAVAVVPVKAGESTIGTLEVIKDTKKAHFLAAEIKLLEQIAAQLTDYL